MRKRSRRVEVCFTESEFLDMMEKVKKSHLSVGDFIRRAVKGLEVKEAPSVDILTLIREIRKNGCNIEQILKTANAKGGLDGSQLRGIIKTTSNWKS